MRRAKGVRLLVLGLFCVLLDSGCASQFGEREQKIPVTSTPLGAAVFVNGENVGRTPVLISPLRIKRGQIVRIEAPGYRPLEIRLKRRWSPFLVLGGMIAGAALCGCSALYNNEIEIDPEFGPAVAFIGGAVVGAVVGAVGASGYTLRPRELAVKLTKADGAPRVDTVLVDPEDLRNIKWIRVLRD